MLTMFGTSVVGFEGLGRPVGDVTSAQSGQQKNMGHTTKRRIKKQEKEKTKEKENEKEKE